MRNVLANFYRIAYHFFMKIILGRQQKAKMYFDKIYNIQNNSSFYHLNKKTLQIFEMNRIGCMQQFYYRNIIFQSFDQAYNDMQSRKHLSDPVVHLTYPCRVFIEFVFVGIEMNSIFGITISFSHKYTMLYN